MNMLRAGGMMVLIGLLASAIGCKREAPPPPATKPATTQAATAPATKPALADYVELLRLRDPKVPATQPLGVPVDLEDAGHFVLTEPVHVCGRGDFWITHPDAPPTADVLRKAIDEQIHLTRERVRFVHWTNDEENKPLVRLAVETEDGSIKWIDRDRTLAAGRKDYRFDETLLMADRLIVPTARGVAMLKFNPELSEDYYEIADSGQNPPRVMFDAAGLLAWSPWDGKKPGGAAVHRYLDGKWIDLTTTANWPNRIMHLVPLLDGSVLQLITGDDGKLKLALAVLDAGSVDEATLTALVEQLSDDDPEKREQAHAQLTRYGPASWPVLEKLREEQSPEGRFRIESLLKDRIEPTLGGRKVIDGKATLAERFTDGGVLLHAPAGVSVPQENKPPLVVKPAWVSIRPGRAIELLEPRLVKDADPARQRIFAFGDEWIVSDAEKGPRRLLGNHLEPMLRKDEAKYAHVIGFDRRGRWLFRTDRDAAQTLVLDPTVPDATPRLPVWLIAIEKGKTGWSNENWPAINRGGPRHSWMLREHGWSALDERKDKLNTTTGKAPFGAPAAPAPIAPPPRGAGAIDVNPPARRADVVVATTRASTAPATTRASTAPPPAATAPSPATTTPAPTTASATTHPTEPPLLVDSDGRKYYDGRRTLRVVDRDGKESLWPLPPTAASDDEKFPVVLLRTQDGKLFLFNKPGRVVRIAATPGKAEPFVVEAIFDKRIPASNIRRIWLDPAGRIVFAYEEHRLAILFPSGRIPSQIAKLMLASERDQAP